MKRKIEKQFFIKNGEDFTPMYGFAKAKMHLFDDYENLVMMKGSIITFFRKRPNDPIHLFTDFELIEEEEFFVSANNFDKFFEVLIDPYFTVSEDREEEGHFEFKVGEVYRFANNKFTCISNDKVCPHVYHPSIGTSYGERVDTLNFFNDKYGFPEKDWFIYIEDIEKFNTTKRFDL